METLYVQTDMNACIHLLQSSRLKCMESEVTTRNDSKRDEEPNSNNNNNNS